MKKTTFLVSSLLLPLLSFAQANNKGISPAEAFSSSKGAILEKWFDEVGKVGLLNIQVEHIANLTNKDSMRCIRFDIQSTTSTGPSALLDSNEANQIISFLKYIITTVTNTPPVNSNTDISFTSKYNIQVGCFWQIKNGWNLYLRTDAQDPSTEIDILREDINTLLNTLQSAKAGIATKK